MEGYNGGTAVGYFIQLDIPYDILAPWQILPESGKMRGSVNEKNCILVINKNCVSKLHIYTAGSYC